MLVALPSTELGPGSAVAVACNFRLAGPRDGVEGVLVVSSSLSCIWCCTPEGPAAGGGAWVLATTEARMAILRLRRMLKMDADSDRSVVGAEGPG